MAETEPGLTLTCAERRSPVAGWSGLVDVGRHRLAVDVRGRQPSLLLINGVGGGRRVWEPLRAALPPDLGTIAYDAPGCGGSEPARGPLSVSDQAALAAGVVRALGLTQLDVLGFSFGGMVAQQLARDAPDLVRRLVLVSTGFGVGSWPGSSVALTLLAWPHVMSSPTGVRSLGHYVFGGEPAPRGSGGDRGRALSSSRVHPQSYAGQLFAAAAWSSLPWLASLRQRTLLIAGDRDPLVPVGNATVMAMLIRRAQLHRVVGGGHLILVDQADEVADAVTAFLR